MPAIHRAHGTIFGTAVKRAPFSLFPLARGFDHSGVYAIAHGEREVFRPSLFPGLQISLPDLWPTFRGALRQRSRSSSSSTQRREHVAGVDEHLGPSPPLQSGGRAGDEEGVDPSRRVSDLGDIGEGAHAVYRVLQAQGIAQVTRRERLDLEGFGGATVERGRTVEGEALHHPLGGSRDHQDSGVFGLGLDPLPGV
jgi:hypothetical protein